MMPCWLYLAQFAPVDSRDYLFWGYVMVLAVAFAAALSWLHHQWVTPMKRLERILGDLVNGNTPRTFIIPGAAEYGRVSVLLEKLYAMHRALARQVREEESSLQAVLQSMVEGVIVVDRSHVIREVNDAFKRQFGLTFDPVNRTVLETVREAAIEEVVAATLEKGEAQAREIAIESFQPDSPPRYFDVSSVPARKHDGEVEEAVLVFHEISRLKQLEEVRREFVANVSHELRTPLSIFRGYLETLLDSPNLAAQETKRILEIMRKHSLRLNALVDDLLTLARLESRRITLEPASIRLEPFIKQLVTDFRSKLDEKKMSVLLEFSPELPMLEADPFRLEQVLYNLLDNSIKYSNTGGTITVHAFTDQQRIYIQIRDEGIGIPPADLPHVFERFYRVDKARSREQGGTGLGLSIVKHIVQLHCGGVTADSTPGKGTTVTLNFPRTFQDSGTPLISEHYKSGPIPSMASGAKDSI